MAEEWPWVDRGIWHYLGQCGKNCNILTFFKVTFCTHLCSQLTSEMYWFQGNYVVAVSLSIMYATVFVKVLVCNQVSLLPVPRLSVHCVWTWCTQFYGATAFGHSIMYAHNRPVQCRPVLFTPLQLPTYTCMYMYLACYMYNFWIAFRYMYMYMYECIAT